MELEDGLFYLNAGYCGKSVKTLLDIGAEYTSIDQSLADELGVRIFQDSLRMSPASYMKLGILDSLQIGSITLKTRFAVSSPTVWRHGIGKRPPIRASHGSGRCWGFRR